jgi:hypothetical protein
MRAAAHLPYAQPHCLHEHGPDCLHILLKLGIQAHGQVTKGLQDLQQSVDKQICDKPVQLELQLINIVGMTAASMVTRSQALHVTS